MSDAEARLRNTLADAHAARMMLQMPVDIDLIEHVLGELDDLRELLIDAEGHQLKNASDC